MSDLLHVHTGFTQAIDFVIIAFWSAQDVKTIFMRVSKNESVMLCGGGSPLCAPPSRQTWTRCGSCHSWSVLLRRGGGWSPGRTTSIPSLETNHTQMLICLLFNNNIPAGCHKHSNM